MKTVRRQMALWVPIGVIMAAVGFWSLSSASKDSGGGGKIDLEKVAEYLHAVIEADRTIYTTQVVDRMQEKGITSAVEHWEQQNALPLPAQAGGVQVSIGVGLLVVVAPASVIGQPAPVVVPQPVIVQHAPVIVTEPPVVVAEPRVVYGYPYYRGYHRHWKHRP